MTERCGVVVAHGRMAEGLLSALERVVGEQSNLWAVSNDGRPSDRVAAEIRALLEERAGGRDAYLFSDLEGGSCCQAGNRLLADGVVRAVFNGVNLPMLVEFTFLDELAHDAFVEAMVEKSRGALGVSE